MNYQYQSVFKDYFLEYEKLRLNSGYSESTLYYIKMFDAFLVKKLFL